MREILIARLTKCINEREDAQLTEEQVDFYVGSDMPEHQLLNWVEDTEQCNQPVTVEDVLGLWGE